MKDYESPSAFHKNKLWRRGFLARRFLQVVGPHPVIIRGRYAGFEKKQWFNPDVVERRTFEIFYGYNPRCCHKGTWKRTGFGHWKKVYRPDYLILIWNNYHWPNSPNKSS